MAHPQKKENLIGLPGLRGVFIFLCHMPILDWHSSLAWYYFHYIQYGRCGVIFFFMLSGFIVSYSNCEKVERRELCYGNFMFNRAVRIYPLHIVCLLFAVYLHSDIQNFLPTFFINAALLQSFIPISGVYYSFNGVSWFLSGLMLAYILYVPTQKAVSKGGWLLIPFILALVAIPFVSFQIKGDLQYWAFYISPYARFFDFFIGMLLCKVRGYILPVLNRYATILQFFAVLLFVAVFLQQEKIAEVARYSWYFWIPMAAIILSFSVNNGILCRFVQIKPIAWFGKISFSFFLIHQLVIKFFQKKIQMGWEIHNEYLLLALIFCIALILSWLSYEGIENRFTNFIKVQVEKRSRKRLGNLV